YTAVHAVVALVSGGRAAKAQGVLPIEPEEPSIVEAIPSVDPERQHPGYELTHRSVRFEFASASGEAQPQTEFGAAFRGGGRLLTLGSKGVFVVVGCRRRRP